MVKFGKNPSPDQEIQSACESLICDLYSSTKIAKTTGELRCRLFCQGNEKSEGLPPTSDSLLQHIRRANFQCYIWRKALEPNQRLPPPVGNEWQHEGGKLTPLFYDKTKCPNRCARADKMSMQEIWMYHQLFLQAG